MIKEFKNLAKIAQEKLRLSDEERISLLQSLREKTGAEFSDLPRPSVVTRSPFWGLITWTDFSAIIYQRVTIKAMPLAIFAFLILGGSISYAAEDSLPGDTLYGVKVHLNERARDVLAVSDESQAELDAELASERIDEAVALSARGELNDERRAEIENRFKDRVSDIENRLNKIKDNAGKAKVAAGLEVAINAHKRSIDKFATMSSENADLAVNLRSHADKAFKVRGDAEASIAASSTSPDVKEAAENRRDEAESKIKKAEEALSDAIDLSAEASTTAAMSISDAKDLLAKGDASMSSGNFGAAFIYFQKSHFAAMSALIAIHSDLSFRHGEDKDDDDDEDGDKKDHKNNDKDDRDDDDDEDEAGPTTSSRDRYERDDRSDNLRNEDDDEDENEDDEDKDDEDDGDDDERGRDINLNLNIKGGIHTSLRE